MAETLLCSPAPAISIPSLQVVTKDGLPYYVYELSKHRLVSAAATGNRLYMLALRCNSIQWRRAGDKAVRIRDSFRVPPKVDDV